MALLKLCQSKHWNIINVANNARLFATSVRSCAKKSSSVEEEELKKKPVRFTTSAAYNLNPNSTLIRNPEDDETPWFQGPIIAFSMACFLIYFTMIREENEIDDQLSGRLFDKVDGLEKASILNKISYNEKYGLDSTELLKRLKELEEEEASA